jgi:PHD/YefM family antitoxin component YafN of YafNO toxin-antitoxin module
MAHLNEETAEHRPTVQVDHEAEAARRASAALFIRYMDRVNRVLATRARRHNGQRAANKAHNDQENHTN